MREKDFPEVLAEVLPSPDRVFTPPGDDSNAIEQRHILIYGGPGSGKTNAFRYLAECLAEMYGGDQIYVAWSDGDLASLLDKISPSHLVQLLCCEDMTRIRQPEEAIHGYFTIRHIMARRTGSRHGLVVTAFTTHDLYGVQPKSLRTDCDLTLFLETPANTYDQRLAVEILGEETYRSLQEAEKQRQGNPEYKGWIAYATKWKKGLTYIPRSAFSLDSPKKEHTPQIQIRTRNSAVAPATSEELRPFHEMLLYLVWKGYTSSKDLQERLYTVHPDEVWRGLEELEAMGYLKLQGPRNRVLALIFQQEWLLTSQGVDYAARKTKEWKTKKS